MSSVRAILCQRKCTGTFVYLELSTGKYFASQDVEIVPRRKSDKIESTEPIVHRKKFDEIVSPATFDRAHDNLDVPTPSVAHKRRPTSVVVRHRRSGLTSFPSRLP